MRLTVEQLTPFGADGGLVHFVDTAFLLDDDLKRVGVAVSGGGDSMALLHVAKCWSDLSGVPIEAVTVNHGLRDEAAGEAKIVADYCAKHGIPHATLQWDGASATGNIAAAGRTARYKLISDWAKMRGIPGVLLGHTQDDVAETFLMRLARKSGVDGLALMDTRFDRDGVAWARPFWQQSRADLRDYLRRHDVPWVDDPTNDDETHDRPKARKALAALAPLGITPETLKGVALNMAGARTALEHYTMEDARRAVTLEAGDVVITHRINPPVPTEIERRLLIGAIRYVSGADYAPRYSALVELDAGLSLTRKHTLAGCMFTRVKTTVRISRELNACEGPVVFDNPTTRLLWDGRWLVSKTGNEMTGNITIKALGDALSEVPDWRDLGLPRDTLRATPGVFQGETLISAPVAGYQNGFEARIVADFASVLLSR